MIAKNIFFSLALIRNFMDFMDLCCPKVDFLNFSRAARCVEQAKYLFKGRRVKNAVIYN